MISEPNYILGIQQNIYKAKKFPTCTTQINPPSQLLALLPLGFGLHGIMQPLSLTPVFKIHKPSKLCPFNNRSMQSEPLTNETNYIDVLLGPLNEKPRNLVTRSLHTCHNCLQKISHAPHRNLTRRSSLDTLVALLVPLSTNL